MRSLEDRSQGGVRCSKSGFVRRLPGAESSQWGHDLIPQSQAAFDCEKGHMGKNQGSRGLTLITCGSTSRRKDVSPGKWKKLLSSQVFICTILLFPWLQLTVWRAVLLVSLASKTNTAVFIFCLFQRQPGQTQLGLSFTFLACLLPLPFVVPSFSPGFTAAPRGSAAVFARSFSRRVRLNDEQTRSRALTETQAEDFCWFVRVLRLEWRRSHALTCVR